MTAPGHQPVRPGEPQAPAVQTDRNPVRYSLERLIATHTHLGKGRLRRLLTGSPDVPIFERPYGIDWAGKDLLVTDPGAGTVIRLSLTGRILKSPAGLFSGPIGVADCDVGVVVSDSRMGGVALLNDRMQLVRWIARDLDRPTGVACGGDRLFVVETGQHRVLVLAPERNSSAGPDPTAAGVLERTSVVPPAQLLSVLGQRGDAASEFNFPTSISVWQGSLWVADTLNFRLQQFALQSGELVASFGRLGAASGEMPRLKGLDVDADGTLWISDAYLDEVALYDTDGTFLTALGGSGAGPGEFSFPAGIAAHPDGRIAVVDSLNRRLQIFRLLSPGSAPAGHRHEPS